MDCGKISNVWFIKNSKTKIFKGFAYIEFKQSSSTYAAIKKNGVEF
jgi:RNA recognition motif-containing protein